MRTDQKHKPCTWLQTVWKRKIKDVFDQINNSKNGLGRFSLEEARKMLLKCDSDNEKAIKELMQLRRNQVISCVG